MNEPSPPFEQLLAHDRRTERRMAWGEMIALALIVALVLWRLHVAS